MSAVRARYVVCRWCQHGYYTTLTVDCCPRCLRSHHRGH